MHTFLHSFYFEVEGVLVIRSSAVTLFITSFHPPIFLLRPLIVFILTKEVPIALPWNDNDMQVSILWCSLLGLELEPPYNYLSISIRSGSTFVVSESTKVTVTRYNLSVMIFIRDVKIREFSNKLSMQVKIARENNRCVKKVNVCLRFS